MEKYQYINISIYFGFFFFLIFQTSIITLIPRYVMNASILKIARHYVRSLNHFKLIYLLFTVGKLFLAIFIYQFIKTVNISIDCAGTPLSFFLNIYRPVFSA